MTTLMTRNYSREGCSSQRMSNVSRVHAHWKSAKFKEEGHLQSFHRLSQEIVKFKRDVANNFFKSQTI